MSVDAIQREVWQDPSQPVSGPSPRGTPGTWVIHYPGGGFAPTGAALAGYLRNIQAVYLRERGYSIGYNWGVGQDGSRWEIRGDDFNNAANAGRKVVGNFNDVSQSIFVMVSQDDPATPVAVDSINSIIATHPDWDVIVHGDVDYTLCAGAGLTAQVRSGVIGAPVPVVEPPFNEEDIVVAYIAVPPASRKGSPWLVVVNGSVRPAVTNDLNYGLKVWQMADQYATQQYDDLLKAAGLA